MCFYKPHTIRPRYYHFLGTVALAVAAAIMTLVHWPPAVPGLPLSAAIALPLVTIFAWFCFAMATVGLMHPDDRHPDMSTLGPLTRGEGGRALVVRSGYRTWHRFACVMIAFTGILLLPSAVSDLLVLVSALVGKSWVALVVPVVLLILYGLWWCLRLRRQWPSGIDHYLVRPSYEPPLLLAAGTAIWVAFALPDWGLEGYSWSARSLHALYLLLCAPSSLMLMSGLMAVGFLGCLLVAGVRSRHQRGLDPRKRHGTSGGAFPAKAPGAPRREGEA